MIGREVADAIEECKEVTNNKSYAELCEGIDITTWGAPEDELQVILAEMMSIDDFTLLRDDFKVSDGDAKVFVKVNGGRVAVSLANPQRELAKYSRKRKEIYVESEIKND